MQKFRNRACGLKSRGFSYFSSSFVFLSFFSFAFDSTSLLFRAIVHCCLHCFTRYNINRRPLCFASLLFHSLMLSRGMQTFEPHHFCNLAPRQQSSPLKHHAQTKTPRPPGPSANLPFIIADQRGNLKSVVLLGRSGRTRPTLCISIQGSTTKARGEDRQRRESFVHFHPRSLET